MNIWTKEILSMGMVAVAEAKAKVEEKKIKL